jgi:hypothetical protein
MILFRGLHEVSGSLKPTSGQSYNNHRTIEPILPLG